MLASVSAQRFTGVCPHKSFERGVCTATCVNECVVKTTTIPLHEHCPVTCIATVDITGAQQCHRSVTPRSECDRPHPACCTTDAAAVSNKCTTCKCELPSGVECTVVEWSGVECICSMHTVHKLMSVADRRLLPLHPPAFEGRAERGGDVGRSSALFRARDKT
jgi:hypothetical protein